MVERLEWLSVLRGLCILLVVMFHVQLIDLQTGQNHVVCNMLTLPFNPIRMPLFIFSSGGLLYLSRISKKWTVKALYIDKTYRIIIPFLFFVTVYYVIKLGMLSFVKTPVKVTWRDYFESFIIFEGHASAPLWFLATLMTLMLLYPIFIKLLDQYIKSILFLLFTIFFYFIDMEGLLSSNYFHILSINKYLIYFYFGIIFFRYQLYRFTDNHIIFILFFIFYLFFYHFNVPIATSLVGIFMLMSACQLITKHVKGIFSSFRDNIYQIYLLSFVFQGIVELLLWRRFYDEQMFWLFYFMNILFGIYGPILVVLCIKRCNIRLLRLVFGLRIDERV